MKWKKSNKLLVYFQNKVKQNQANLIFNKIFLISKIINFKISNKVKIS
jgi:hypothetical protein